MEVGIVMTIAALLSVAAAWGSWEAAKAILKLEKLRHKSTAFVQFKERAPGGLVAVLFAFRDSLEVKRALQNYSNEIEARRDNPPSNISRENTVQWRSHCSIQWEVNRQQKKLDWLYNRVLEVMCEDLGVEGNHYLILAGFTVRDLENKARNPL